jgi:cytochrome c
MIVNQRPVIVLGILVIFFLTCCGCMQNPVSVPVPVPSTAMPAPAVEKPSPSVTGALSGMTTKAEMVSFVKEAVAYARLNGKEKALVEFSRRNGSFFRGELYIYAYDANGTTIAHPVNPEKIGVNRLNEKDAEGNLFIQELRSAAWDGTGFVTYYYINPTHNNAIEKKLGYAMNVDSTWWLGSGIYQGPADTPVSPAIGMVAGNDSGQGQK